MFMNTPPIPVRVTGVSAKVKIAQYSSVSYKGRYQIISFQQLTNFKKELY